MPYRFATEKTDYTDYAAGRVFYAGPGQAALPIRLTNEIWQRCMAIRRATGAQAPASLYDPCCGSGYHLAALAFLHQPDINTIMASDVDASVLQLATRNLELITANGLSARLAEITALSQQFGKQSHRDALVSIERLRASLAADAQVHPITTLLFRADATQRLELTNGLHNRQIDVVLTDVPYGGLSSWQLSQPLARAVGPAPWGGASRRPPLWHMLDALQHVISATTVIAIVTDKVQQCAHENYRRIERFQVGKRRVTILQTR